MTKQTLNSVLRWSTFAAWRIVSYDAISFTHQNWAIICYSHHLKLCLLGWGQIDAHFQVSPEIFDRVQAQAVAGALKDVHRGVCISHSCCVFKVIILLEGEPLPSLRFWMLWTGLALRQGKFIYIAHFIQHHSLNVANVLAHLISSGRWFIIAKSGLPLFCVNPWYF